MPVAAGGIEEFNQTKFQEEIMKKFWIVLLALGLVAGFAMSASAADVKFSGSYYLLGFYADNPTMNKDQATTTGAPGPQSIFAQRLRVETTFKVAEGLNLVTRFDALERTWGDKTWQGTGDTYSRLQAGATTGATAKAQENIEFERAYLDFTTKIGRFQAGYIQFISWGTDFHDTNLTRAGIKWFIPVGPLTVIAAFEKTADSNSGSYSSTLSGGTAADADNNIYDLGAIYKWSTGDAGIIYQKGLLKNGRNVNNYGIDLNIFIPYAKAKFGPVYVEGELVTGFGDYRAWDDAGKSSGPKTNITASQIALSLHAKADIGPAYVGARFIYITGDDPKTTDKIEGGLMTLLKSGDAFNPMLIMWNDQYTNWLGKIQSVPSALGTNPYTGTAGGMDTYMDNTWFYMIYGGFKPTPSLDIQLSVAYAYADQKPWGDVQWTAGKSTGTQFGSDVYGTEVDLTAKYKIYENLEYMAGFAYMFTGDYFKGASTTFNTANNYLLMHKLTLTF